MLRGEEGGSGRAQDGSDGARGGGTSPGPAIGEGLVDRTDDALRERPGAGRVERAAGG